MSSFKVNNSGQIMVGSGTKLDYEGKRTYMVTVTATDPLGASSSIPVTIEVTNVDEAPEITVGGLAVSGDSSVEVEEGSTAVASYTASGPDADMATWSLSGDDAGDFAISSSGVLTFTITPDYENPADANTDNTYMVTVAASDSGGLSDPIDVTITVTDVDENVAPADPLKDKYDANDNGEIERPEVFAAIDDYLDGGAGAPTRADVFKLIELYLGD